MKCFIWNLTNDREDFALVSTEMSRGILRQGWGCRGMDIRQSLDDYQKAWPWAKDQDEIKFKYNQLRRLLEISPGDLIVVKGIMNNSDKRVPCGFTIAKCIESYNFSPIQNDFGHFIKIECLNSYKFDTSTKLGSLLRGYRFAITDVSNNIELTKIINWLAKPQTEEFLRWL